MTNEQSQLRHLSAWGLVIPTALFTTICLPAISETPNAFTFSDPSIIKSVDKFEGTYLSGYICFDIARRKQALESSPSLKDVDPSGPVGSFFSRSRLILVNLTKFKGDEKKSLIKAVLLSLQAWNSACSNCDPASSAVLKVDGTFWVLSYLVDAIANARSLEPERPLTIPLVGQVVGSTINDYLDKIDRFDFLFGRGSGGMKPNSRYLEVDQETPGVKRICDTGNAIIDPRLAPLREILCNAYEPDAIYSMVPVDDGSLGCNEDDVVACTVGTTIRMNIRDFNFESDGNKIFGDGATKVDLLRVLLHETGHWIGFAHTPSQRVNDIMNGAYNPNLCLNDQDVHDMETLTFTGFAPDNAPLALVYHHN